MRALVVLLVLVAAIQLVLPDAAEALACRPIGGTTEAECKKKIRKCKQIGVIMKWTGKGCRTYNNIWKDGGCQCDQYCGYRCKQPCDRDSQCIWLSGGCHNILSGLKGGEMPQCTPMPSTAPTHQPSTSPSETPTTASPTISCNRDVDVIWALDESNSVKLSPNVFQEMKTLVNELISCPGTLAACTAPFTGSPQHSLMTFSGESYFQPTVFSNIGLETVFESSPYSGLIGSLMTRNAAGGFTRTDALLARVRERFNGPSTRRRVLVLLADGLPSDEYGFPGAPKAVNSTFTEAESLLNENGVYLMLVKTPSIFPTRNNEDYLDPLPLEEFDFNTIRENEDGKNEFLESLYNCF